MQKHLNRILMVTCVANLILLGSLTFNSHPQAPLLKRFTRLRS